MNQTQFSLAFVTGASSGIGAGICRLLARKGIPLLITGRDASRLLALSDELKGLVPVETVIADIADPEDCRLLTAKIHERVPDLIINNAGLGLYGKALNHATKDLQAIVDVNVSGLLQFTVEGAKALLSAGKKGVILNVSSASDLITFPGLAVYAASKAFVTQFSKSMDDEMKASGIRILVSCPGVVATDFRRRASGGAEDKPDKHAMDVPFAAGQVWNQILNGRQVHVFDWKTRILAFFARNILPQSLVSKILLRITSSYQSK
ncbi:MAG TPA: SDR family NAD(P)-dependent oxidoreductase [Parachlamydiaceae bacterium]|nr:SDR family NAD(P)-dependent oxidoreductase [Parachlamydiaceae bacterium]